MEEVIRSVCVYVCVLGEVWFRKCRSVESVGAGGGEECEEKKKKEMIFPLSLNSAPVGHFLYSIFLTRLAIGH
jgi:hypothetical protein